MLVLFRDNPDTGSGQRTWGGVHRGSPAGVAINRPPHGD
jgi:hypothetical protein